MDINQICDIIREFLTNMSYNSQFKAAQSIKACLDEILKPFDHPKKAHKSIEEIVRKEVQLRSESFVYIDKNDDISKICTTVNGLLGQVLRPTVITLTRHPESSLHISKLVRWFRNYMDNKNIEWRVEAIPAQTGENIRNDCLDAAIRRNKANFYSVWCAGFKPPKEYHKSIDNAFFDNLDRFVMLEPYNDINGLFVQNDVHKRAHGNTPTAIDNDSDETLIIDNIIDKVKQWAIAGEFEHMIKKASDICPIKK